MQLRLRVLVSCLPLALCALSACLPSTLAQVQAPRTVRIVNQCPADYWLLPVSGAAPFASSLATTCSADSDCVAGAFCLLPEARRCFWSAPVPASGAFKVPANGGVNSLTFASAESEEDVVWSGNLGFCQRGTCGPFPPLETEAQCDASGCSVYSGPANTVELTMSKTGSDFYDLSNIAGVNVPLSLSPLLTSASYSPLLPYSCGSPGASVSAFPSSWRFSPPSPYYVWVTAGSGVPCLLDSDCGGQLSCGLSSLPGRVPQLQLECGTTIGYWSANAVCAAEPTAAAPFNCQEPLPAPNAGSTLDSLIRCSDALASSCYEPGATDGCCGCVDWQTELGSAAVPASTPRCVNSNPNWSSLVLPELLWLKAGAPSAYSFPFDDTSSTFTCSQKPDGLNNHVDYEIVLCPSAA